VKSRGLTREFADHTPVEILKGLVASIDNSEAYLSEISAWARGGRNGRRPSPLPYGLHLSDFTSSELQAAENDVRMVKLLVHQRSPMPSD
jgi:hypothetical protein